MDELQPDNMWKGARPITFARAQQLRLTMTVAESLLWEELRSNKMDGYRFRRQHPIHFFIADFYCHKLKLIIEVDGGYHDTESQIEWDGYRTELLEFQGISILRFSNEEVMTNIGSVKNQIVSFINDQGRDQIGDI